MMKMTKKTVLVTVLSIIIFIQLYSIIFYAMPIKMVTAQSEITSDKAEEKLNETLTDLIDGLDLRALQDYVNSLNDFSDKKVSERLLDYIKGENFQYESFTQGLLSVFFEKVKEIIPAFACIAAVALLSGLLNNLKSGSNAQTSSEMIFLITYVAALIPLLGILTECFTVTADSVQSMQTQMQIVYPIMLTLMATSGGALSVSVCRPAVSFFSTTIVSVISSIVLPLTITIIAFSMASNLTKELKISKFSAFFKSINKWLIGISVSVFGLFFTLQGITSTTYDGIVRRAAKYALGNGVPIVGGFLSGGFDLAVAGSILIKNSLGSMSIFLMISVLFEPLLLLIAVNVMLRFTAAVTQPLGDSRISDFLGETADNLHYCSAGLLFTAFLYFLSIVMLVSFSEAIF